MFRPAFKHLQRHPLLSGAIIGTLALALTAAVTVASLIDSYLFRPIPHVDDERVMLLPEIDPAVETANSRTWMSWESILDIRREATAFEALGVASNAAFTVYGPDATEVAYIPRVSAEFFPLMGVKAAHGQVINESNAMVAGQPALLLSDSLWSRRFGRDPGVVGDTVRLDNITARVVGVLPADFVMPTLGVGQQGWVAMIPEQLPPGTRVAGRNFLFGKVAAEHTLGQAADEIARLGKRLSEQHPKRNSQRMAIAVPLRDAMMGPFQRQLWILFAMAVLVLLVACLNSGSLLLAQAMHRRREFAVRLALGANHGRLLRQFWLENIGLTLLAALLSLLLAMWVTPLLMAMLPTFIVGNFLGPVAIQWGAWSVALSCALGAALLFALLPWGIARHLPIEETLRSGGRSTGGGMAGRLGRWFVSGQIAVALTLAVGAGLLLQSGRQLQGTDFGFPTEELFQFRLSTRGERYAEDADRDRFYQNVRRELAQLPGVRGVSMARFSFPNPNTTQRSFVQEGDGLSLLESPKQAQIEQASPETLETFGLRLLHGRFVEETDTAEMPPVTVVSAALAERYWPGENPVGKRVRLETMGENWWTVVGVVSDRLSAGHRPRVADTFIVPFAQVVPAGTAVFVRFAGAEPPAYETMQRKIWDMNPDASMFFNVRVSEFYANSAWQQRFSSTLISGFAGLAIVLCATGLYAVLAFMVASRTREMGIRSALGANSRDLYGHMLRHALGMILPGLGVGLILAGFGARSLQSLLYNVPALSPTIYVTTALAMGMVCLLAAWLPARRATQVDPSDALRAE